MRNVISWDWYRDPRVLEVEERQVYPDGVDKTRGFLDYYFERLLASFQRHVHAACAAEVPPGLG